MVNKVSAVEDTASDKPDVTPCPDEVEDMALVLEGQHGRFAAEVADFFSAVHGQKGDASRAWAWQGVAVRVRRREQARGGSISHILPQTAWAQ
ncbi:MAG: hypothetical protein AAFR23_08915 [Pseudomonadota bacterium]